MRRPARALGLVVVALVAAAVLLWASSRLTWVSASWDTPLRGRVLAAATGAATEPVLVPWALLSLAAVAGVLATSGWGRRAVGVVTAVAGLWALVRALTGLAAPAADALPDALPDAARESGRLAGVAVGVAGPVLAALGALLLAGAGVLVALVAPRLPRLGARYDAPTGAPASPSSPGTRGRPARGADPDAELWKALDAGEDPTAAEPVPPVGGASADRSDRSPRGERGPG